MPFKKGDKNINRKGAPKRDWTWSGELQKAVEEKLNTGVPVKELVAKSLVKESLGGNVQAIKELMNRMDGMPQQDMKIDGEMKVEGVVIYKPEKNKQ